MTGTYNENDQAVVQSSAASTMSAGGTTLVGRTSISSASDTHSTTPRRTPRKEEIAKGPAVPISQLAPDAANAKLFQSAPPPESGGSSPVKTSAASVYGDQSQRLADPVTPISSSLPTNSPLTAAAEDVDVVVAANTRSNSELGHYSDYSDVKAGLGRTSPEVQRKRDKRRSVNPLKPASIPEHEPSPEREDPHTPRVDAHGKVKISGPMNGTPIPAGYKFGKEPPPPDSTPPVDRREKAKSRTFWGFGRQHGQLCRHSVELTIWFV